MTGRQSVAAALALALLALSSASIHCGRTLRIANVDGAPVEGVFVIYHYEDQRLSLAHGTSYEAGGRSIVQGDSSGHVEISRSLHVHWPFPIETNPELRVDLVYAPALHNGWATIGDRAIVQPGAFQVAGDLSNVQLADLSDKPDLWEGTLMNLSSIIDRLIGDPQIAALTRVLAGHFREEYSAFLNKYGTVVRSRPPVPGGLTEGEVRDWIEMTDRELAREPFWGDVARRLFAREADRYARLE